MDNPARQTDLPLVVILGGGFAGRAAGRALRQAMHRRQCRVILLDRNPLTTMVPALPDYAAGLMDAAHITAPIPRLLPKGIAWQQAQITAVDLAQRQLQTSAGPQHFDYLIIATGSVARPAETGWPPRASHPLATLADADKIRQDFPAYLASTAQPHIVFSGAGYTGLESAATLGTAAHRQGIHCRITLVEHRAEILPFLSSRQRRRVKNWLQRHDIQVLTNNQIIRFDGHNAELSSGTKLTDVFLCRTAGTCAPLSLPNGQAPALPDGRLLVTDCLQLPDHPNVYAVGDAAAISQRDGYLRKAVNFAVYSGSRAGNNVARALLNRPAVPFRPIDLGWVIPLMDDSVGTAMNYVPLQGRTGLGLHYFMCGLRNFNLNNFFYFVKRAFTVTIRSKAR